MIQPSFDYLRTGTGWERTVLIGGVLTLFSFLLIPAFVLMGYVLRVFRATMHGEPDQPPVFDEWGELTVDGLKGFVITFVYGLVPGVVFLGTFGLGAIGLVSGSNAGAVTGGLVLLVGGLATVVLNLAVAYVLPAALLNYAEKGTLGAGFAFGDITSILTTRAYVTAFVYVLAVFLGFGIVAGLLNIVPFLGTIAGAFVGFYAAVMAAYIYGTAYAEMQSVDVTGDAGLDERVAV